MGNSKQTFIFWGNWFKKDFTKRGKWHFKICGIFPCVIWVREVVQRASLWRFFLAKIGHFMRQFKWQSQSFNKNILFVYMLYKIFEWKCIFTYFIITIYNNNNNIIICWITFCTFGRDLTLLTSKWILLHATHNIFCLKLIP